MGLKYGISVCLVGMLCLTIIDYAQHRVTSKHTYTVVCTTNIIGEAAQIIGAPYINVITLMGPGIDPHVYKAREGDINRLAQADLILYNGLHLEGKLAWLLDKMSAYVPTYAVTYALDKTQLRSTYGDDACFDPHVWLDVSYWKIIVLYISDLLSKHQPEHRAQFHANTQAYIKKLDDLALYMMTQLAKIPAQKRILITAHDAFGYFGKRYGFQVVGLQGLSTESDIGLCALQKLVTFIVEHQIPVIFAESCISPRALHAVQYAAQARGHTVTLGKELYTDSLGDVGTPAASYVGMITSNIDTIVEGLTQGP